MEKSFSSKIGVLLAAAGSAVGLGSIWKFPYVVGENGGGAFIILYIVCSLIFGLPLVMNEFLIGKLSGRSAYGAYRSLSGTNRWQWLSWANLLCVLAIMSFYFVVTGWFVPKTRYQGSRVDSFLYLVVLRWLVPIAIVIIFLDSVNII